MKNKFLVLFLLFVSFTVYAQWSSDPMLNLQISDLNGDQATPKIAPTTDGGCYIAWFDNRGGSYAMYLQRLNAAGVKQFAPDGLLISSNPQNSSLVDYDLICDANNNAVLVFTDIRNGGQINPFAYMISPAGSQLWGANGVTLSDSINSFQAIPRAVATSDGNYIFVWRIGSGPQKIAMQKLNAAGVKQWGGGSPLYVTSGTNENYDWCDITASDNGGMIMMWSGYTGTFISPVNYRIYSQKFSSTGTRVWNGTQDTVYSLGRVSGFYEPKVYSDGNNGALYMWQDDRNLTNRSTTYLQRKTSAGAIMFPVNGSAVSTDAANNHFSGSAAVFPNGETIAIYTETDGLQNQRGVYAQKFSTNGTRQWTDNAKVITSLGTPAPSFLWVYTRDTNAVAGFSELQSGVNVQVKAFRLGQTGGFVWPGNIVTASGISSEKIRMQAAINNTGMLMMTWSDRRNDGGGAYAQNVNLNGTLGGTVGIINYTGTATRFSLAQNYPNPFNPVTKISFSIPAGTMGITSLEIYDISGKLVSTLVNGELNSGTYEAEWDAVNYSSGVYLYKLVSGSFTETKKMILVK